MMQRSAIEKIQFFPARLDGNGVRLCNSVDSIVGILSANDFR
jgi:hypothetical protein